MSKSHVHFEYVRLESDESIPHRSVLLNGLWIPAESRSISFEILAIGVEIHIKKLSDARGRGWGPCDVKMVEGPAIETAAPSPQNVALRSVEHEL